MYLSWLLFNLQKFTSFDSLTGGPRMHPDMLFSLLSDSLVLCRGESSRKVGLWYWSPQILSRLKKLACRKSYCLVSHLTQCLSFQSETKWSLLFHELGVQERKSIHIKNRAWSPSPSLTDFPLSHFLHQLSLLNGLNGQKQPVKCNQFPKQSI